MFKINARVSRETAIAFHHGSEEAIAEIYRSFRRPILSFLMRRVDSAGSAEELTHDVFLKAIRSRKLYDPSQDFARWLWTVARNILNDHFRRRDQRAQHLPADGPEAEREGIHAQLATEDIETHLVKNSERNMLMRFLKPLTRLQREALSLRLVQKLSYAEISRRMSLSLSSVKSLIHRAQASVKRAFRRENRRLELMERPLLRLELANQGFAPRMARERELDEACEELGIADS